MSMWKKIDKFLCRMLDYLPTFEKWRVDIGTYSGGHFKDFSSKEKALEYANKYKGKGYFVDLVNENTEESIRIDGPTKNKKKDPHCKHEWQTIGRSSWWCSKCNAQYNLACEHGGSMACSACVNDIVKKNEPFNDYLAEHSW